MENDLGGVHEVVVTDDGHGISPADVDGPFAMVGEHRASRRSDRDTIGTKGIGRFSVFALAYAASWSSVAETEHGRLRQRWTLATEVRQIEVETTNTGEPTGTTVTLELKGTDGVRRLFSGTRNVQRVLFNAFAGYMLRYRDVTVAVNGEPLVLDDFVENEVVEAIAGGDGPEATLRHVILGAQVDQDEPNVLVFAAAGNTIRRQPIDDPPIDGKKYLGLVDSAYLQELTNTARDA